MEKTFEFTTTAGLVEELLGTDIIQMMKDFGRVTFTSLAIIPEPAPAAQFMRHVSYAVEVPYDD